MGLKSYILFKEGFVTAVHRPIGQADTILLTYPLNWNMSRDIMRNDLQIYEQVTDDRTPAMTWSFFTVGWKWVGDVARMQSTFLRSYQDYLISPFNVNPSQTAQFIVIL